MSEPIVPAKLPEGISRAMYNFACEFIWGVPMPDIDFFTESILWKERSPIIFKRYPLLEKSFNDEHERMSAWYKKEVMRNPKAQYMEWMLNNVPEDMRWYPYKLAPDYFVRKARWYRITRRRQMRNK